jgi:hypothetical protein
LVKKNVDRKVYGSWMPLNLGVVLQFKISTKAVEKFLKTQKNCLSEYVGTELALKRGKNSLRADVFGVSKGKLLYSKEE